MHSSGERPSGTPRCADSNYLVERLRTYRPVKGQNSSPVTSPGESSSFHSSIIRHDGNIARQLELDAVGVAAAQIEMVIVEHRLQHPDQFFDAPVPVGIA